MSTYEAAYKSLLQGVSQQLPEERLPGQVTAQTNMVSDPVTNLRRRPGVLFKADWAWPDSDYEHVLAWFTDIAGSRVHILLNCNTGQIKILGEDYAEQATLEGGPYLTAPVGNIRAAAVGNEFFLGCTSVVPSTLPPSGVADPANSGFMYISAGAFSRAYNVSVVGVDGTTTASYTTPSGASPGDAALTTPEYIATQLANQFLANSFTDVRMLGIEVQNQVAGTPATPALRRVPNGSSSPTYLTMPDESAVSEYNGQGSGKMQWEDTGTAGYKDYEYRYRFQVRIAGVWNSTVLYTPWVRIVRYSFAVVDITSAEIASAVSLAGLSTILVAREGPYVFFTKAGGISVTTTVGQSYMITSGGGLVSSAGNLPARLPPSADGYIVRVGTGPSPTYYRYTHATSEWAEVGSYGSPSGIAGTPVSIRWDGSGWVLDASLFEGRYAGDDESNPLHEWVSAGITGMATYQGRLVLMSGPMVSLSASNKPRRFFRSTVTSLLNSDPIEIGSSTNSAAAYEWAVPFQKDLLLFSRAYQAVLPSGNAAITPATATVVPTSSHEVDTTTSPITLGRTVMYCTPRSEDFFGVLEMVPSNYTDSQYVSQDSTPHLPKYMGGRCRFAVSSGVASMALFAPSGDPYSLVVHEYHWDGDTKAQQAWHRWTFEYPIATAYFASDVVVLGFVQNGHIVLGTIDPRAGAVNAQSQRRPFLDLYVNTEFEDNLINVPAWMLAFDPAIATKLTAVAVEGALAGERIGTSVMVGELPTLVTVRSWPSGTAGLGLPYYSGVIPAPPVVRDYQSEVIHTGKATLLRYLIGTRNSSEFSVNVTDDYSVDSDLAVPTLSWDSPELDVGRALFSNSAMSIVPCRTDLRSTAMEVFTEGTGELNVTALEYVAKYNPKIKRR